MNSCKKLLRRARANPRTLLVLLMAVLLLAGLVALYAKAVQESNARKSPEAQQFEKTPEDWLEHDRNVSHFRKALDAGHLAAVGLANGQPGLVMYTLKNGERASSMVSLPLDMMRSRWL